MDRYCSTCNTAVVPSTVGYLCPGCGAVHKFEHTAALPTAVKLDEFIQSDIDNKPAKIQKTVHRRKSHKKPAHKKTAKVSDLTIKKTDADNTFVDLTAPPQPIDQVHNFKHTEAKPSVERLNNDTVKSTMKRLLVPELPAPHFSNPSMSPVAVATSSSMPTVADLEPTKEEVYEPVSHTPVIMPVAAGLTVNDSDSQNETTPDEIVHGKMMQAELEDKPATNTIHVIAIILASLLLVVAAVLIYIVAR